MEVQGRSNALLRYKCLFENAARASGFRGLDRLAVNDAGRGARLTAGLLAGDSNKSVIDPSEGAIARPGVEIILNGGVRRELLWQLTPLAAGRGEIQDGIDHGPQTGHPGTADPPGGRHERLDQRPFGIGEITCITQSVSPILSASGVGPRHRELHRIVANPRESQRLEATQPFSVSLSERPL